MSFAPGNIEEASSISYTLALLKNPILFTLNIQLNIVDLLYIWRALIHHIYRQNTLVIVIFNIISGRATLKVHKHVTKYINSASAFVAPLYTTNIEVGLGTRAIHFNFNVPIPRPTSLYVLCERCGDSFWTQSYSLTAFLVLFAFLI